MAMKRGAVSLLALMLVTGAAWAQDATTDGTGDAAAQTEAQAPADAPADAPAAPADAAPAIPDEVLAILNDETPLANLDPGQLRKRMRAAQGFAKQQGLPDDVRARLQDVASAARAELDAREAAAQQPADAGQSAAPADVGGERPAAPVGKRKKQPQQQPADQAPDQAPAAADQQQTQNPPADAAPAADAGDAQAPTLPRPLVSLLTDDRPVSGLSDEDLQNKLRMAKALKKRPALPEDVSQQLESIIAAAEAETQKRAAGTPQVEPPKQADAPPPAAQPAQTDAGQKPATPDAANVQQLDANPANPEAEKKAKAFLAGNLDPNSLNDDDLRNRLDAMRDLLAENELSLPTERALRKELRDERDVLRARVEKAKAAEEAKKAAAEAAAAQAQQQQQSGQKPGQKPGQQPGQQPGMKGPKIVIMPQITINTPIPKILADRRRSEDLTDDELRRRIEVYRDIRNNRDYGSYGEDQRNGWNDAMVNDREVLHRRMVDERRRRAQEMDMGEPTGDPADEFSFNVQDTYQPGRHVPRNVFEAEADDEEIADVLVAPPKRKVTQRYTVDEIASRPDLRDAMPRIEIDTIHFGFNEAYVREEEINNLDRIASIMERVLRKYPREVFLVEGHTDAVGSDAYNLKLSRARAEAVKRALTTYYVIPPQNLKAVGLGERYLKIPTADPEAENRRVSISRATPLIGEAQD